MTLRIMGEACTDGLSKRYFEVEVCELHVTLTRTSIFGARSPIVAQEYIVVLRLGVFATNMIPGFFF